MATPVPLNDALRDEYEALFASARVRPEHVREVTATAHRVMLPANLARYRAVEAATGVPAWVVGIIHSMEAGGNFSSHLHNGDPLTERTVQVPAGRPTAGVPPFTWEASAIDALRFHDLDQWTEWTVAGIGYVFERYNGFGYRNNHPEVKSPYLWSFTTVYSSGKYIEDHKWSPTAVSKQCGAMAILRPLVDAGQVSLPTRPLPAEDDGAAVTPHVSEAAGVHAAPAAAPPYPGHTLRINVREPAVGMVQQRLLDLGIREVGDVDSDFGEDTERAVKLFQARSADDAGAPLTIDGVVGQKTWRALFGINTPPSAAPVASGPLIDAVLSIAAGQIGQRESPLGSNRGEMVDQYLTNVDAALLGNPWCMAFVYWCFQQAAMQSGSTNLVPRTAGVLEAWRRSQGRPGVEILLAADAIKDPDQVKPGMVFFMDFGGGMGHCGIVAEMIDGRPVTIEGNSNDDGSREGIRRLQARAAPD